MKKRAVLLAVSAAGLGLLLGSCALPPGDVHARLSAFVDALNNPDRTTINANFDPALTADLPTMDSTWWSTNFPVPLDADHLYGLTLFDYADPANVAGTLWGPPAFNGNTGLPRNVLLVLSRAGSDWLIQQLFLDGSSTALIK